MPLSVTAQQLADNKEIIKFLNNQGELYRVMGDAVPYGVWMTHANGEPIYTSQSFLDLLEMELESFIERGLDHRLHPDDVQADKVDRELCRSTGKKRDFERRLLGPDGKYHYVLTRGEPIYDEKGNIKLWVGINLDIDKRKQVEAENFRLLRQVEQEQQRLETFIAHVPGMVWEIMGDPTDPQHVLSFANDYVFDLYGYPAKDWLTIPNFRFKVMYPDDVERVKREFQNIYQNNKNGKVEYRMVRRDAVVIWVEAQCSVIQDGAGRPIGIRGVTTEITQRKLESERKDEFLSIASHELKTPITSIRGFTQILDKQLEDLNYQDIRTYLNKVNSYVDKLMAIVGELLDISRIQTGKLTLDISRFDLIELLKETINDVQVTTKHEIKFLPLVDSSGNKSTEGYRKLMVKGDEKRIAQVIVNLLANAIKYSPHANKVIVSVAEKNGEAIVSIKDFGIGIPKSKQRNIFQRYYRAHDHESVYTGLGIGLYVSYKIIGRHGGEMKVLSEENKGSTFFFTLPAKGICAQQ